MIITNHRINVKGRGEHFHIIPISDIHLGTPNCDEEKLIETVDYIASKTNIYWLGGGDYIEGINYNDDRFDIEALKEKYHCKLHDLAAEQRKAITKILMPIKDRCLGLLEGNHEEKLRLKWNQSPVDEMASVDNLNTKNLSYVAMIKLQFIRAKHAVDSVDIWCHHGYGGGRAIGGNMNNLINKAREFRADIFLMGHCHKKLVFSSPQLGIPQRGSLTLLEHKQLFGIMGTFYRTYNPDGKSYGEKAGYSPTETGVINIRIEPFRRKFANGKEIELPPHLHISA